MNRVLEEEEEEPAGGGGGLRSTAVPTGVIAPSRSTPSLLSLPSTRVERSPNSDSSPAGHQGYSLIVPPVQTARVVPLHESSWPWLFNLRHSQPCHTRAAH